MKNTLRNTMMVLTLLGLFTLIAYAAAPDVMKFNAKLGTVTFTHKAHEGLEGMTCKTCHHTSEGTKVDQKCRDCHKDKAEGKTLSLKDAFHKQCKDCHKAKNKGPHAKCVDCHIKAN